LNLREWADLADLQMFLMGFEAGEQWAYRSEDNQTYTAPQIASWLLLANKEVDQAIKAAKGQTSEVIPAEMRGHATRNDERTRQKL
jgi:hypothetical protein